MTTRAEWEERVRAELDGRDPTEALATLLPEGFRFPALTAETPHDSGLPGEWPYARGPIAGGRRPRNVPRILAGDAARFRDEIRQDLRGGADGLWIVGTAEHPEPIEVVSALRQVPFEKLLLAVDVDGDPLRSSAIVEAVTAEVPGVHAVLFADPFSGGVPIDRPFAIPCRAWHGAGAHAVLELAYAAATGVHALRMLQRSGVDPAAGATRVGFSVSVGRDVLAEIAKLRALRVLWAKILAAAGIVAPPPWIHAASSVRRLPRGGPWNNVLRVSTSVFAAICGGADAITAAPFDAPLGHPSRAARRTARNTVSILREECALADVADPAGGAPAVELLTDRLARGAWERFRAIEASGGMVRCVLSGEIRREIEAAAAARASEPLIGVNEYPDPEDGPAEAAPRPPQEARR